jgi:hypothetical protein
MTQLVAANVGCAVQSLSGIYGRPEALLKTVAKNLTAGTPIIIFAVNTEMEKSPPKSKTQGTQLADFITDKGLGTITKVVTPDNGVHLGTGEVTLFVWLVDYEKFAKYLKDIAAPLHTSWDVSKWDRGLFKSNYHKLANVNNRDIKSEEELGWAVEAQKA